MTLTPLPLLTGAPAPAKISPEWVRISMASAYALRFRSGRFTRDFEFGGINLLLNYDEGCLSDCGYCGLARTRPGTYTDKSFIRVEWPLVGTDDLVDRMVRHHDRADPAVHLDGDPRPRLPRHLRHHQAHRRARVRAAVDPGRPARR